MGSNTDVLRRVCTSPGAVLLHGPGWSAGGGLLFDAPVRVLAPAESDALIACLEDVDRLLDDGYHVAGYLSYEAGEALMGMERPARTGPLAWLGVYAEAPARVHAAALEGSREAAATGIDLRPTRLAYSEAFRAVKHHIHEGDVYQINLTGRGSFRVTGPPEALYRRLRNRQPAAYGAVINTGEELLLSFSPELFFEREGDQIRTRPMKGTAPRGRDAEQDASARRRLAQDAKNRAENLMIVDLLRNDLSVVCRPGSVDTRKLFEVEALPTVWQMTSEVRGRLRADVRCIDIMRALFPCGSITGAPKRRAMEIIQRLEPAPRGIYCGAIGYAAPQQRAVFNVAIRTVRVQGQEATLGAGGGIVWDSEEVSEFEEMHLKTRFCAGSTAALPPDFHLIETMRVGDGTIRLLKLHLARLERSARYFGIAADEASIRGRLVRAAAGIHGGGVLRLTLHRAGDVRVTSLPARKWPDELRVVIAQERVCSTDPLIYHKTSCRGVYDRTYEWAREAGADEAILLNERGEVTEGTRSSIFVLREGRWMTPAVTCGLLPGVFREWWRTQKDVDEVVLTPADLADADAIVLGNAVRGSVFASLVTIEQPA